MAVLNFTFKTSLSHRKAQEEIMLLRKAKMMAVLL
jgi:hypothetical protein